MIASKHRYSRLPAIKLSYFEAFNAVMLTGSMTGAASMMHTSQPNISRSISRLEKETGLKLFERVPGKLVPTADGLALYKEVQRSFVGLSRLTDAAARIQRAGSGILRLGAVQSHSLSLVPRAVALFTNAFPQVSISIHAAHSDVLSQWVREHSCDMAIVSTAEVGEGLDHEVLYTIDGVCVMPLDHKLTAKSVVTPQDLEGEQFINFPRGDPPRRGTDEILGHAGVRVIDTIETSYSSISCSLVMQGVGVALVNPFIARGFVHGLAIRPIVPAPRHIANMIFPKGKPRGRPVESIVAILKQLVAEEQQTLAAALRAGQ